MARLPGKCRDPSGWNKGQKILAVASLQAPICHLSWFSPRCVLWHCEPRTLTQFNSQSSFLVMTPLWAPERSGWKALPSLSRWSGADTGWNRPGCGHTTGGRDPRPSDHNPTLLPQRRLPKNRWRPCKFPKCNEHTSASVVSSGPVTDIL